MPHNGKKVQGNFWFLPTGELHPFLNVVRAAAVWTCVDNTTRYQPDKHDVNGWPMLDYGSPAGERLNCFFPSIEHRPGKWVVKWTSQGIGSRTIGHSVGTSAGTKTGNSGRFTLTFAAGVSTCQLSVDGNDGTNYVNSLVMVHEDDEALFDAGQIFNTKFLEIVSELGVIRFLDWFEINTTNVVTWAHRKPLGHYSWAPTATHYLTDRYISSTTAVGDAYSGTLLGATPGGVVADKTLIHVKFTQSCSGDTPTFDLNGTGAKGILGANINAFFPPDRPVATRVGTMVFDTLLDNWILKGGNANFDQGITASVPIEIIAALCLEVGAHAWVHIPHYAADNLSDFTSSLATYMKAQFAGTGLKTIYEVSNEVWNFSGGFEGSPYFNNREFARVGSGGSYEHQGYGRAVSLVGQAVSAVYGADRSLYGMMCCCQAYGDPTGSAPRLTAANFVTQTGNANDAAKFWVTHTSCATYWHSSYAATATETTWVAEYPDATTVRKSEILVEYLTSTAGANQFTLAASMTKALLWKNFGTTHGVTGFMPYEGGYDYGWNSNQMTQDAYYAPILQSLTLQQYEYLDTIGDFSSIYTIEGNSDWGFFKNTLYDTPSTQWLAVLEFNPDDSEPEVPAPSSGGGGAAHPTKIKHEKERKQLLKKHEQQLEQTIRLAYQRLTGKVTEPPQLKQDISPQKLAMLAEKMAEQLIEKSKDSAKQRTRNKEIIKDLQRQAAAIMQEEEEAIVMLLH